MIALLLTHSCFFFVCVCICMCPGVSFNFPRLLLRRLVDLYNTFIPTPKVASAAVYSKVSIMLLLVHCWLVLPVCVCVWGGWSYCDLVIYVLSWLATGKEGAGC